MLLSGFLHSVVERPGIQCWINVSDLNIRPEMITVVVKGVVRILRFRFVQPEDPDSLIVVIRFGLLPDILPRFRIRRVKMQRVALEVHGDRIPFVHPDQQAFAFHLLKVFAAIVHRGPDGNHEFDTHLLQLPDHGVRVRPVGRVKLPLALKRPVEEIAYDNGNGNVAPFEFPGNPEQFLLRLITEFALPVAHGVIRHHGNASRRAGIGFLDFCRIVSGGDPVIQFFGGFRFPGRNILPESNPPDGRIVPEEAVAEAGQQKRHAGLGVSLRQLQIGSLQVQEGLLILAHTVKFLVWVGNETHRQPVVAADDRFELPGFHIQRGTGVPEHIPAVAQVFLQQDFPLLIIKGNPADQVDFRADFAVDNAPVIFRCRNLNFGCVFLRQERPVLRVHFRGFPGPHAKAVFSPRLNDHAFRLIPVAQRIAPALKITENDSDFILSSHNPKSSFILLRHPQSGRRRYISARR